MSNYDPYDEQPRRHATEEEEGSIFDMTDEELESLTAEMDDYSDFSDYGEKSGGWDGISRPDVDDFETYEDFYEALSEWKTTQKLHQLGMTAQPQSDPIAQEAAFRKVLNDDDLVLFDKHQELRRQIDVWDKDLKEAVTEEEVERAAFWKPEAQAELSELLDENPELAIQREHRTKQAEHLEQVLINYAEKPTHERVKHLKDAQEICEWMDQLSDAERSWAVDNSGHVFVLEHPGTGCRDATLDASRNELALDYPSHLRKLLAHNNRIGIAGKWRKTQVTGEVGGRPAKPKAETQPQGDWEVVSARPGEDHQVEHFSREEVEDEFQKKREPQGPRPKRTFWDNF